MQKYLTLFEVFWENEFVYRLNFVLWRVRTVLQLLLIYFIWWTVFQSQNSVFGYTEGTILTYIVATALVRAIILSTRASGIASQINDGTFANFLVKPFNVVSYYIMQDLADKLLNVSFVVFELVLLIILLKPPIFIQTNFLYWGLFLISIILGIVLFFEMNFIIGLSAFWLESVVWGPQFLLMIFMEGLGGGLFPIDILPNNLASILFLTPFPYLVYFPAKLYLGSLGVEEIIKSFFILSLWIVALWFFMQKLLKSGLRYYTAVGH